MALLDRLERKLSPYAIPGLIRYIAILNALVFLLARFSPGYLSVLTLDPEKILQGQIWRLVSYIFIPDTQSFIFIFFFIAFLWYIGDELEAEWGTFRLNLFYFSGMFFNTVAAFFFGGSGTYLNLSLIFAFATVFPDAQILLLIIPVKAKWLGWLYAILLVIGALVLPLYAKIGIAVSLFNYFLFFGPSFIRGQFQRQKAAARKSKFEQALAEDDASTHRCAVCGRTNSSNPELEFRVSADGNDYCIEHLPNRKK